jgi:hypothetical protein
MDRDEDDIKLSTPGLDGYGSSYSKSKLEKFLTDLGYPWEYFELQGNRYHEMIVVHKKG